MSQMSERDILRRQQLQRELPRLFDLERVAYDDDSCALCGSRNFELLEDITFECYDWGKTFERGN